MGNSLRCCLACVLPCGALDLIRVVHINGHVDEYSGPVSAADVLRANPNHILSKPCPLDDPCSAEPRRAVIVGPDSVLKRGEIYFLLPEPASKAAAVAADEAKQRRKERPAADVQKARRAPRKPLSEIPPVEAAETVDNVSHTTGAAAAAAAEGYLTELMSERKTMHRRRRSGRVGVWRHQLESITEDD